MGSTSKIKNMNIFAVLNLCVVGEREGSGVGGGWMGWGGGRMRESSPSPSRTLQTEKLF